MDAQHEVGQTVPIQRREVPRFLTNDVMINIETMKSNIAARGNSVNVSTQGVCGTFDAPLPLSERVNLELKFFASEKKCACKGRVMWGTTVAEKQFACGIGFLELENTTMFQPLLEYIEMSSLKLTRDERRTAERRDINRTILDPGTRKTERRITKTLLKKCINNSRIDYLNKQKVFFRKFNTVAQPKVLLEGKEVFSFNYCNYLGFNHDQRIKNIMKDAIDTYGTTTISSPLLGGTMDIHKNLEKKLAEFFCAEDCITYPMGYLANQGCISSLIHPSDFIIVDEYSHASIIDACILSRGKLITYKHNNMKNLEQQLKKTHGGKLIVTDGVFSMDGDIAQLDVIYELAQKYDACIMVDDAHGIGILGKKGGGIVEHFGLEGKIDILMGTMSKAIPLIGGYIVGKKKIVDYLRWTSRAFIFNLSLPPYIVVTAMKILEIIQNEPEIREKLWWNILFMRKGLRKLCFNIGNPQAAVIPVLIGNHELTYRFSEELEKTGIVVDSVAYPAVSKSESRLRLIITAAHHMDSMQKALESFQSVGRKLDLIA